MRCLSGGGTCLRAVLIGISIVTLLTPNPNKKSQTISYKIDQTNNIINMQYRFICNYDYFKARPIQEQDNKNMEWIVKKIFGVEKLVSKF